MFSLRWIFAMLLILHGLTEVSGAEAPTGNAYEVLDRMVRPFTKVLLGNGQNSERALQGRFRIAAVGGGLPPNLVGAEIKAWVEHPDKVRVEFTVGNEVFTVVRKGQTVWALPGAHIERLLEQFPNSPPRTPSNGSLLSIPITAEQTVFWVSLIEVLNRHEAVLEQHGNETLRVITARLQPEVAQAAGAEDLSACVWVDGSYRPRRVQLVGRDFSVVVDFLQVRFHPTLPSATWAPPAEATNLFRTTADYLEAVLYVFLDSLHTNPDALSKQNEPRKTP